MVIEWMKGWKKYKNERTAELKEGWMKGWINEWNNP